jgi:hypothetical protein
MQRGAESSKVKGRNSWRERKSVTAARGVNPFSRKTLPLVPRDAAENLARRAPKQPSLRHGGPGPQVIQLVCVSLSDEKVNRHARSEPPLAVVHLFIFAENNGPVYDMGA